MASYTREEREARKNYAKDRSIVEVAESLGMELVKSGAEYRWKEHDSMVITPRTNLWHWFSQDKGGDTIELVRTINNISFNQAIDYLNDGDYSEGTLQHNDAPQAFKNYLAPYEQPFVEGRSYLKEVRGLSDETIDFFLDQNVITQANAKIGDTIEPVIVFKTIDHKGKMIGGNLQGIVENRERYDKHGYLKGIMRNSNGNNGLSVDIGSPERLVFAESPIDLMSYYELHKDQLENVRLVSMDGLKDGIIGTNLARLESEMRNVFMRDEDWDRDLLKKSVDDGYFNDGKHADVITLAVDNDQGGRNFIQSLEAKGIVVKAELPAEKDGFEKQDWNDALKEQKAAPKHPQDNSRLAQAERKLERLEAIQNHMANTTISPAAQSLIDEGNVTQWAKRPNIYFVKGLRKVALELNSDGVFEQSSNPRYLAKNDEDIARVQDLLAKQNNLLGEASPAEEVEVAENTPMSEEETRLADIKRRMAAADQGESGETLSPEDEGWLVDNWDKLTFTVEPIKSVVYDVKELPQEQANVIEPEEPLEEPMTYQAFTEALEQSKQSLTDKLQAGELHVQLDDATYFYQLVRKTGWSHPMKQLSDKGIEALKPYRELFESITADTIDAYKTKGTPEQDRLYEVLKEVRKKANFPSISTEFTAEMAISAYAVNGDMASLSPDTWAQRTTDPVGTLATNISDVLEYPFNEVSNDAYRNALYLRKGLYDLLNDQEGNYTITPETYQSLMDRGANITLRDDEQEESQEVAQNKVTSPEITQEPALQVLFDFSESREIAALYKNGQVIPYQEFVENLYRENSYQTFGGTYDKTYFSLIDEKGQELVEFRYDLGSESETLSEQLSETLAPAYLELAQAIDQEASSQIEGTEKAPDQNQGPVAEESSMGLDNLSVSNEDTQKERTNFSKGSLQPEAEGSTAPVSESSDTFERSVTSRPTLSSHPLHFSITEDFKSNKIDSYHAIRPSELARLNRRADHLQKSAKFYYDELADSKISYFTSNGDIVQVSFAEENFMHLTGIKPIGEGQTPQKTLRDFVSGHGEFQNIYLAPQNNAFKKLDVLQDIEVTLQTDTFYFDDLQDVDRYSGRFDSLLKADDSDLMLIFRDTDNQGLVPVSVFKATDTLRSELKETTKNEIIGIFRERDGQIEKIAINDQLISDDGQEMFEILKNLSADNAHEVTHKSSQLDEPYTSDKIAVKQGISDRVREIIAEGSARKTPEASKEDQRVNHSVTVETRLEEPQELDTRQENAPQTFPVEQELDVFSYQTAKAEELSAQAIKAIRSYAANPEDLKEYLDFMAHFTKYSPRNTALIHEQWRGANAVATYKQWEALGKRMGIGPDDVLGGTNVEYTNDRTGKTRTIKNEGLSVRAGQKGHIKLFKAMMDEMIPVLDETGQQLKNDKGYPKYKPKKKATAAEEEAIKQGRLEVKSFPKRDLKTGKALYETFTVFELSQTNLKPEKYPNIMPNRHYDFDTDKVKTQEVLLGLKDYADCLGVSIEKVDMMSNVKGQFNKEDQSIQLNDQNTKGEMVGTLIHELAHATLHNPKFKDCYKEEVPKEVKELEAEMTSYVTAKHFGLDTSEKAIPYMANWTDKLSKLSDDELDQSMKRVHETTKKMLKAVEKHTKPLAQRLSPEQGLSQHQNLNPLPPKM